MKAVVQDRYGGPDRLAVRNIDPPTVGDDEVLVRVCAAGCGPDVWHTMTGLPYMARLGLGLRSPKQPIQGRDVAGVVEAVGGAVRDVAPGDEVLGVADGSFAELAVATADKLVVKPERLTFEQAAAVPVSGLTALHAVRDVADVRAGQRVLVVGAGGGVGTFAVQIATALGATVTAVCSAEKHDLVRSIGAVDAIDYRREDFTNGARRWDVVVDTAGRRPIATLRRAIEPGGALAIVGGDGGGRWTGGFFRGMLRAPALSPFVSQKLRGVLSTENQTDLRALLDLIEEHHVTPVVGRTYALADAADALRYLEQGHAEGKVVITIQ